MLRGTLLRVGQDGRRDLFAVLLLVLIVATVYANSLDGPFVFDDWHVIPENPAVQRLSAIPSFFFETAPFSILPGNRDWRPLFLTSMALCWAAGDGSTLPFHLVSLTLHAANTVLLFLIFGRLARRHGHAAWRERPAWVRAGAFVAAAAFGLHPLATESVLYISSQSVPLAACGYLAAAWMFLRAHDTDAPAGRGVRIGGPAAYGLALLAKPIAITLPLNLFVWEALFGTGPPRARLRRHVPYLVISALYIVVREWVFTARFGGDAPRGRWVHWLTETEALVHYYLRLTVLPLGQNADREYPVVETVFDPGLIVAGLVLAALGASLLYLRRRHPLAVFWTVWFPVCLLVTTYGVVLRQVVNEHRVYLSLAGFGGLLGLAAIELAARGRRQRIAVTVAAALLLGGYAVATHVRNDVWSSDLSLWADAASHNGTWRAHMNYGLALDEVGRGDEALSELRRAVELGPYAYAHLNLGLALLRRDERETGLSHLETAVRLWPTSAETHFYYAWGLERQGDLAGAERELREALRLRPDYLRGLERLARFLERQNRGAEALEPWRRLAALQPQRDDVRTQIAALEAGAFGATPQRRMFTELNAGRYAEAVALLGPQLLERPDDPELLFALGFAEQRSGRPVEAIEAYEALLRVAPRHRQGLFNLAHARLYGSGPEEWAHAAELFRRVLTVDPTYSEAWHHRATALWKLGMAEAARQADQAYVDAASTSPDLVARSRERLSGGGGAAAGAGAGAGG